MLSILSVMLVMITVSNAGNRLYNDICATVSKSNASSRVARVECHSDSVIFDPKSQKGTFLFSNETGSWTGESFACQCGCSLPNNLQDGWILTTGRIQHGKSPEYKCDYETKTTGKIICLDGILVTVPDFLDDYNIVAAFRQKSSPELNNFQNKVFQLCVNNMSVHESEVSNNHKYTDILTEKDTALNYYLFNGKDFMIGTIEQKMGKQIECSRRCFESEWRIAVIVLGSVLGIVLAFIIIIIIKRCCCPIEETVSGNKRKDKTKSAEKEKKELDNPSNSLIQGAISVEETTDTV